MRFISDVIIPVGTLYLMGHTPSKNQYYMGNSNSTCSRFGDLVCNMNFTIVIPLKSIWEKKKNNRRGLKLVSDADF